MKSISLLPSRFKKAGAFLSPTGAFFWVAVQKGAANSLPSSATLIPLILTASAICFLGGLILLVFSREKKEDEFIAQIRLQSFQFAGLFQLCFFASCFLWHLVSRQEPAGDKGLELFLIFSIALFWLAYLCRFYFVLYWKGRRLLPEDAQQH